MAKLFLEFPVDKIPSCCRECPVREEHYSPVTDKTKCRINDEWNENPDKMPENCPMGHMIARDDFKRTNQHSNENDERSCKTCDNCLAYQDEQNYECYGVPECKNHDHWIPRQELVEEDAPCEACGIDILDDATSAKYGR